MDFSFIGNGVLAHRGNMSEFPENTMASFKSAIEVGAGWLELDIQRTKDGHLVVTHDFDTGRVADKKLVVTQNNLSELKKLNFGAYVNDNKFYELPLLSEVFQLLKDHKDVRVTIQPKNNGLVKDSIKLAEQYGLLDRIAFNDINCEYLIEVKQLNSNIPVFWDRLPGTDFDTDLFIGKQFGFDCLMYLKEALNEEKAKKIKQNGFILGACVVNEKSDMIKFLEMGVETFYTDYPALLLDLKKTIKNK